MQIAMFYFRVLHIVGSTRVMMGRPRFYASGVADGDKTEETSSTRFERFGRAADGCSHVPSEATHRLD